MRGNDLLIVGGGIIGCTIAWEAARRGRRVIVIERGEVGGAATHAAGGMLAPLSEADRDTPFLRLCQLSAALYPGFVSLLRESVDLDVEYRTEGTLYLSLSESDDIELESRYRWQCDSGFNVQRLSSSELHQLEPALNPAVRWALFFPQDCQINNRLLISAVRRAALSQGVIFRTGKSVDRLLIEKAMGQSSILGVVTEAGNIAADQVVLAAGSWSSRIEGAPATGVEPVRGQMIAVVNTSPPVRHVVYSHRGYLVPRLDGRLIAGSTTEEVGFDCRHTDAGISTITANATEMLPDFTKQPVIEKWAGLRPRAADHLPILGADPHIRGLFHATGHYRNGILLAPLTARVIVDLLTGRSPEIDPHPFLPGRVLSHSQPGR